MSTPRCTWDDDLGWLTPEHRADCRAADCKGCRPCGKAHCAFRGRCANHVEQHAGIYTCPSCIGKVRRTVRSILTRYSELPSEFDFVGVESEALNLHGPAADHGQWVARRAILSDAYAERGWCDFPKHAGMADDDPHHPLAVLGRWDIAIRESYGHTSDLFVTVSRAVDYLTGDVLDRFAHTREFEEFAKETTDCLSHLEDVLALSVRPEQGAPCPTCRVELAGKVDDEGRPKKAPRLHKRYGRDQTGLDDTWHCPAVPAHWWSHRDYRDRVDEDYLKHADRLTAKQLQAAHGIAPGTVRQWASRGKVAKRGMNSFGQVLYDVAQAKALNDGHAEARHA